MKILHLSVLDCRARKLARNDAGAIPFWIAKLLSLRLPVPSVIAAVHLSLRAEGEAIHAFFRMDCRARKLARNDAGAIPFWIAKLLSLRLPVPSVIAAVHLSLRAEGEAIHVFFRMDCRARKLARNDAGAVPFWIAKLAGSPSAMTQKSTLKRKSSATRSFYSMLNLLCIYFMSV